MFVCMRENHWVAFELQQFLEFFQEPIHVREAVYFSVFYLF